MTTKDIESAALRLTPRARARLASKLLASLDGKPDPDAEQAWYDEAERRAKDCAEGRVQTIPAEEVFRKLRAKLR